MPATTVQLVRVRTSSTHVVYARIARSRHPPYFLYRGGAGLEMGSRAPNNYARLRRFAADATLHALHVQEEWLAQALASEQRTETCHRFAFCHFK